MKKLTVFLCVVGLVFEVSGTANSALIDMGNGTIYSTILDVTWIKDPVQFGEMNWDEAQQFVNDLEFAGYNDWKLQEAYAPPHYGEHPLYILYTEELGNDLFMSWHDEVFNQGPFHFYDYFYFYGHASFRYNGIFNYWSSTESAHDGDADLAEGFFLYDFTIFLAPKTHLAGVFPMREGRGPLPVPSAIWLLGSGLIGLLGFRRKFWKAQEA